MQQTESMIQSPEVRRSGADPRNVKYSVLLEGKGVMVAKVGKMTCTQFRL